MTVDTQRALREQLARIKAAMRAAAEDNRRWFGQLRALGRQLQAGPNALGDTLDALVNFDYTIAGIIQDQPDSIEGLRRALRAGHLYLAVSDDLFARLERAAAHAAARESRAALCRVLGFAAASHSVIQAAAGTHADLATAMRDVGTADDSWLAADPWLQAGPNVLGDTLVALTKFDYLITGITQDLPNTPAGLGLLVDAAALYLDISEDLYDRLAAALVPPSKDAAAAADARKKLEAKVAAIVGDAPSLRQRRVISDTAEAALSVSADLLGSLQSALESHVSSVITAQVDPQLQSLRTGLSKKADQSELEARSKQIDDLAAHMAQIEQAAATKEQVEAVKHQIQSVGTSVEALRGTKADQLDILVLQDRDTLLTEELNSLNTHKADDIVVRRISDHLTATSDSVTDLRRQLSAQSDLDALLRAWPRSPSLRDVSDLLDRISAYLAGEHTLLSREQASRLSALLAPTPALIQNYRAADAIGERARARQKFSAVTALINTALASYEKASA